MLREFGAAPRLVVYLASAPGAGKTRRLIEDALRAVAEGKRVAVGWLETKGRPDLEVLAAPLPRIPPRAVQRATATFADFDFAGAVMVHPQLIVLDELAHTNAEGGAHAKRWQDALALRDAGISVIGALNIQHVESVAAAAESIIGFPVHEIVPLSFLKAADQVIALDVSPEQIEARLRAGRIVRPDDVERALHGAFRPQTLRMLRELMLRTIDDLTIPAVSPAETSTALALVTADGDPASFVRRAARDRGPARSQTRARAPHPESRSTAISRRSPPTTMRNASSSTGFDWRDRSSARSRRRWSPFRAGRWQRSSRANRSNATSSSSTHLRWKVRPETGKTSDRWCKPPATNCASVTAR